MERRPRYAIGFAFLGIVTIAAVTCWLFHSYRNSIPYHKSQMEQAYAAHFAEPDVYQGGLVGYTSGDEYERYEFHRSKLIELGAVLELNFKFKHLLAPSDESNHFTRFIMSDAQPPCIDFSSPYPQHPAPMQLTVWCYPEHKSAWDELITSRDVSHYEQLFME